MDSTTQAAYWAIARFCGLYTLGTLFIMAGLSFDACASLRSGALMTILLSGILLYQSGRIPERMVRAVQSAVPAHKQESQRASVLMHHQRDTIEIAYITFSQWTMSLAVVLWVVSLIAGMSN
ncbi:hypothetical protein E1162_16360 [Rhodobacteraceae bacterium RKSG542]|uniref:hypothetical protein n=1 Tax=Pseudovibrio flavus TaxID=2529854 RepID=UPI0012BD8009|nr:hypothetical protein [Pseudovibrio flavus]MTI18821.1 hypothetical protein [Pseudovibrio flavus]